MFAQSKTRKGDVHEQIGKKFYKQIPAAGVGDGTGGHDGDVGNAGFRCC